MSQFAFNPYKTEQKPADNINHERFFEWTKNNFYRTNYGTMTSNNQYQPKEKTIVGYAGFIPGMRSQSGFSKSYTKLTKESFASEKLGQNPYSLSSTGFNSKTHDFVDPSKHAVNHKYGKSCIIKPHPSQNGPSWQSQTKDSFQNPSSLSNPTYQPSDKFLVSQKQITKLSGFQSNINVCDAQGWKPHQVLDGDRQRTSYRVEISRDKPVHRDTTILNLRKHK